MKTIDIEEILGEEVEINDKGVPVSLICEKPVYIGQKFCGECGRKLIWKKGEENGRECKGLPEAGNADE